MSPGPSGSHVFIVLSDITRISCDARASSYAVNPTNLLSVSCTKRWFSYPHSLLEASK